MTKETYDYITNLWDKTILTTEQIEVLKNYTE